MPKDVLITPASALVQFKENGGTVQGYMQLSDANALVISGNVTVGTTAGDVYIGDGVSAANIVFEQGGAVYALATKTLTLGLANSFLSLAGNVTSGANITGNVLAGNLLTTGLVSATGNVTCANLNITGGIFDTGALDLNSASNGNITLNPNGTGVIVANKDIRNGQANGVGNIGSSTGYFNTVFAKATSAQYADVAEKYIADRPYTPGTVMEIGGPAEVQATTAYASTRIAGVVSTTPAFLMNSTEQDANAVELALLGRVPCRVTGTIRRGDLLTSSDRPGVATALAAPDYIPGCVIGKALQAHSGGGESIIEVLVGRL